MPKHASKFGIVLRVFVFVGAGWLGCCGAAMRPETTLLASAYGKPRSFQLVPKFIYSRAVARLNVCRLCSVMIEVSSE